MVVRIEMLRNPVSELYCLFDDFHREGFFFVESKNSESKHFSSFNDAIKHFDSISKNSSEKVRIERDGIVYEFSDWEAANKLGFFR
jgi:hypothetical protein